MYKNIIESLDCEDSETVKTLSYELARMGSALELSSAYSLLTVALHNINPETPITLASLTLALRVAATQARLNESLH